MKDSRNKTKEIEDKYNKYKKDISNERMFLFRINNLFTNEFDELINDQEASQELGLEDANIIYSDNELYTSMIKSDIFGEPDIEEFMNSGGNRKYVTISSLLRIAETFSGALSAERLSSPAKTSILENFIALLERI